MPTASIWMRVGRVPGTQYLVPGTRCQAPGTRHLAPDTLHQGPGAVVQWYTVLGTRCQVPRHLAPSTRHLVPAAGPHVSIWIRLGRPTCIHIDACIHFAISLQHPKYSIYSIWHPNGCVHPLLPFVCNIHIYEGSTSFQTAGPGGPSLGPGPRRAQVHCRGRVPTGLGSPLGPGPDRA